MDSESPLYKARVKLQDAVSSDTSNPLSCYHLGRLCLLLGEDEVATSLLMSALSLKPTHSESRYCLGVALGTSNYSKPLLLHGLSEYLRQGQEVNESQPNPTRLNLKELNAKTLYRASNPLVVCNWCVCIHTCTLSLCVGGRVSVSCQTRGGWSSKPHSLPAGSDSLCSSGLPATQRVHLREAPLG